MMVLMMRAPYFSPVVARHHNSFSEKVPNASSAFGHVTTNANTNFKRRRRTTENTKNKNNNRRRGTLIVRNGDLGGNYGDSFADVDNLLVNYFTFKALKSSLAQMQETDLSREKASINGCIILPARTIKTTDRNSYERYSRKEEEITRND